MKKWKNYLSFVAFSLLFSVFIPCFISENTSATSWQYTFDKNSLSDNTFYDLSVLGYDFSISTPVKVSIDFVFSSDGYYSYFVGNHYRSSSNLNFNWTYVYYYCRSNTCNNSGSYSFSFIDYVYSPYSLKFNYGNVTEFKSHLDSMVLTITDDLSSGITPTGNIDITENGTFDVTQYAQATVNVSSSGGGDAPYTGILEGIKVSILTCGAIIVVLYFFYCFYRIIIRSTGGKQ